MALAFAARDQIRMHTFAPRGHRSIGASLAACVALPTFLARVLAIVALLVLLVLTPRIGGVLPDPAHAEELRCGGRLVLPGDSAADVLEKCGAPAARQRLGARGLGAPAAGDASAGRATQRGKAAGGGPSRAADREVWTYASAGQLARHLTFRKGRVAQIDVGGYAR